MNRAAAWEVYRLLKEMARLAAIINDPLISAHVLQIAEAFRRPEDVPLLIALCENLTKEAERQTCLRSLSVH